MASRLLQISCRNIFHLRSFFKINEFNGKYIYKTCIHSSCSLYKNSDKKQNALIIRDSFTEVETKDRETFKDMVKIFEKRDIHRRGHVEFIYSALRHMEEFGVHKDLEVYKALIDVLPKGKFIPTNIFQSEFMHYPKQQQCIIDVLEQMENNGVIPDFELEDILVNIFGRKGHPVRKFWRMMYWMPKFKNLSPWPVPNPPPDDGLELAKMAVERITSVDLQADINVFKTSDVESSLDETWIVSGQSPKQRSLVEKHDKQKAVYVEGAHKVWLRNKAINYFILRADPLPLVKRLKKDADDISKLSFNYITKLPSKVLVPTERSVHEQDDGVILAVCATGSSSRDSLLSWIRLLEKNGNPALAVIPVLFKLKSPSGDIVVTETNTNSETKPQEIKS